MKKKRWILCIKGSIFVVAMLAYAPHVVQAEGTSSAALATINGRSVTEADLLSMSNKQLVRNLQNQIYLARKQALDSFIIDELVEQEAKKQGVSREQLIQQEVDAKAPPATDAQIKEFFDANKTRLGGKSLDETKAAIASHLQSQARQTVHKNFIANLRKAANVKLLIQPPPLNISLVGAPTRGPANAPVTIVEFSDFQ